MIQYKVIQNIQVNNQTGPAAAGVNVASGIITISNGYMRSSENVVLIENPLIVTGSIITP